MTDLDKNRVEDFFTNAAINHKNENAVLDVAAGQSHANIYRNYFTTKYILKNIKPKCNQTILDFGCGVGRITKQLATISAQVIGVDSNSAMIETAKNKFSGNKNCSYQLLQNNKIESANNYFDTAFSHWVFQHIADDECLIWLNEIKRVLKPEGKIYLFEQVKINATTSPNHLFRTAEQYNHLIKSAGLKMIADFPVMRVPARGMSIWNKIRPTKFLLPIVSAIDKLTIKRKPNFADYFTFCFVMSK